MRANPPPSLISLADDLITLASVRGDVAGRARWVQARGLLSPREAMTAAPDPSAVPPDVAEAATSLRHSGWVLREQAIAELPFDLRWLFESGAVTMAELEPLARNLEAITLADLLDLVVNDRIRTTPGLGPDQAAAVAAALPTLRQHVAGTPLGRALELTDSLLGLLRASDGVRWAEPTGSLRRGHDLIGDLDLVVCSERPNDTLDMIASSPDVERVAYRSAERAAFAIGRTQVSVRCHNAAQAAPRWLWTTGSRAHIEHLRAIAEERRLILTADGLAALDGSPRPVESEAALYAALGLPWIPPELRVGTDEIDKARRSALPDLVDRADMLGDLHAHSQWSDGRDSIETMVQTAVTLGYRYLAITDHSPSSAAIRNLQIDDVSRQADEIASVRERYPQIAILHGCEVDILPDGSLDFPDKLLRRFDIILASLHDRAGQSSQQLFRRYLSAMVHPLVTIVTHPTNRVFPRREGYELDYDRLFEAAVETRTVLEIDGAASHLDLDAGLAAKAAAQGVTLAIDSDAHAASQLGRHMHAGLLTARRAGVERHLVFNTRPLPQIRAFIAAKRSRFQA